MNLTEHFTFEELTHSQEAARKGLDNEPDSRAYGYLVELAQKLEQVRKALKYPMVISSGYRSFEVNQAVGGAQHSAHLDGRAADFICPQFGSPYAVCLEIIRAGIQFDQLIYEFGAWTHIAIPLDGNEDRNMVLTATTNGYSGGLVRVP